jgi:hypothetical protein
LAFIVLIPFFSPSPPHVNELKTLTFNAQSTKLRKMMIVEMGVNAEQSANDGFDGRLEVLGEGDACRSAGVIAVVIVAREGWEVDVTREEKRMLAEAEGPEGRTGEERRRGRTDLGGEDGFVVQHGLDPVHQVVDIFCGVVCCCGERAEGGWERER